MRMLPGPLLRERNDDQGGSEHAQVGCAHVPGVVGTRHGNAPDPRVDSPRA
jgi:hypothetical protein